MKVAFDVKGTLIGPDQEKVRDLYNFMRNMKCEMVVWSNLGSYAVDAVKSLKLNARACTKYSMSDAGSGSDVMDLAIEDDSTQTWLAAKHILLVKDIPNDLKSIEKLAKELIKK
jgi:hypothetical protein